MRVVVALGGNALVGRSGKTTYKGLVLAIKRTVRQLAFLVRRKHEIVLVFGSGPQVGALVLQNELAKNKVSPMPLDVLDAQLQGEVGYMLEQALSNELKSIGVRRPVVSVLTQTVVEKKDPAFRNPSKPIGPFYSRKEALSMGKKGLSVTEDAGRGYRRVVPSPNPIKIVESKVISSILGIGAVVIAVGGGGIPVVETKKGFLGVEAVVDKDLAASRLGIEIGADLLVILTAVESAFLFFGSKKQKPLKKASVSEAKSFLLQNHFAEGSMKPKIIASCKFVSATKKIAIITCPGKLSLALTGKAGTVIVP
ncbi:MAG: carbamate kinase [archaeon]|nr:carbamate kinase [archaeon]